MRRNNPRVLLVPFGYPDYPIELLHRFLQMSRDMLTGMNLEVGELSPILVWRDVAPAVEKIRCSDHDALVALLLSWVEAPNVVATLRDFFHQPILLWAHTPFMENGERLTMGALPAAGVIRETLEEMEANFKFVFGLPDDAWVRREVESYARASFAFSRLREAKIGLLGYASMGMYTGTFDHVKVRKELGPEIEHLDQYVLVRKIEASDVRTAQEMALQVAKEWNVSEGIESDDLTWVFRVFLALREIVTEGGYDAITVKCQYELSRLYGFAPCVPLSILGDHMTVSCEGDVLLLLSQLVLHYLTGRVTTYGDVHDVVDNGIIVGACGFAPLSLTVSPPIIHRHSAPVSYTH
ncbi:MAG: hypothetical protein N2205_06560, partial [Candidatus Caldatribacterium sp.]|nr:hypothetical protein [Candidatus Caldatribacterium sp.]